MTSYALRIAEELRSRAGNRGWFSLEMGDVTGERITRLGMYEPQHNAHHSVVLAGNEREHSSGAGVIFAETYERDRSLGGAAPASIVIDHRTGRARVEGRPGALRDELGDILTSVAAATHTEELPYTAGDMRVEWRDTDATYLSLVAQSVALVRAKPDGVICLTTRATVTGETSIDALRVYAELARSSGAPRAGIIVEGETALVSASPETFLHVSAGVLRTSPMKGTRRRGTTATEDAQLADDLRTSEKERRENTAVTRATCDELTTVCDEGTVTVTAACAVVTFEQVHQMVSDVEGVLSHGVTLGRVLDATFPGASMTGVPKSWAIEQLAHRESGERGLYSGCYGWVSECGEDAQVAMAIRCAEISGNTAFVGAGGGITQASDPSSELAEVRLKARAVLSALGARYP